MKIFLKFRNLVLVFAGIITLAYIFAGVTSAQTSGLSCGDQSLTDQNGICLPANPYSSGGGVASSTKIGDVITKVLTILLTLAGVVAVLFIVIGGFQYMTARGNEEQATKGRKTFISALIGLIAILLAYTIVNIIYQTVTKGSIFS